MEYCGFCAIDNITEFTHGLGNFSKLDGTYSWSDYYPAGLRKSTVSIKDQILFYAKSGLKLSDELLSLKSTEQSHNCVYLGMRNIFVHKPIKR